MVKKKTIAQRLNHRASKPSMGVNQVIVARLYPEIAQALQEGWSIFSIWQMLYEDKQITFSYPSLCNHLKKLQAAAAQTAKVVSPHITPIEKVEFRHNAITRKEDLI